ncbi:hypothetical protein POM88_027522 [Heracleum sosnowskyi]|uniref:Arabidopsis retrotransposon Orf1 C-terminal domain-containing protein n=1 Tax=Heracleum sosnowskyi TaxID=360622 RepID=A0AAD8MR15_9APIA|nr:hypothetical protein POM88_027522 [Heracleum sosnowskyi]
MTRSTTFKKPVKKKQKTTDTITAPATPVVPAIQKFPIVKYVGDNQWKLYTILSKRPVFPNKYVDTFSLDLLDCQEEFTHKLAQIGWNDLFNMDEPPFSNLTYEFLSSLTVMDDSTLSFRIANIQHEVTKSSLAKMFDWQLIEQQAPPKNYATPFWLKITGLPSTETYVPQLANSSEIMSPCYRYFTRLMSYTLYGRGKSHGRLQKGELDLLYYFDAGIPVDWTTLLINRLMYQANKADGAIVIGGFITRIAEELGVFDRDTTSLKRVEGWASKLDKEYLIGMHLLRRDNHSRQRLLLVPHKHDPTESGEVIPEENEPRNSLEEQVAHLLKGQDELQSRQAKILQNQESMGKQLREMFAFMQQHFQHSTS